jgi:hypothetical protein
MPKDDATADESAAEKRGAAEAERIKRNMRKSALGYAQSAGHPGGEQDLDKKTEEEEPEEPI